MSEFSIADVIEEVQMDENAKKVFLAMPREEQLLAILGMIAYLRSEIANMKMDQIDYRMERETRERKLVDILDTSPKFKSMSSDQKQTTMDKILVLLNSKVDFWVWARDKVLPQILTVIVLGILYLVFGEKLP